MLAICGEPASRLALVSQTHHARALLRVSLICVSGIQPGAWGMASV